MKALEKDRNRRYETANGLAEDVQRLPGRRAGAGRARRARRTGCGSSSARNRAQVVAAGLVLLALVAGVVGTTLGLVEARRQRDAAEQRKDEAGQRHLAQVREQEAKADRDRADREKRTADEVSPTSCNATC